MSVKAAVEAVKKTLYLRSDGTDKKKKKSIASATPCICRAAKSVSISTFALGDDGLQIGH